MKKKIQVIELKKYNTYNKGFFSTQLKVSSIVVLQTHGILDL